MIIKTNKDPQKSLILFNDNLTMGGIQEFDYSHSLNSVSIFNIKALSIFSKIVKYNYDIVDEDSIYIDNDNYITYYYLNNNKYIIGYISSIYCKISLEETNLIISTDYNIKLPENFEWVNIVKNIYPNYKSDI